MAEGQSCMEVVKGCIKLNGNIHFLVKLGSSLLCDWVHQTPGRYIQLNSCKLLDLILADLWTRYPTRGKECQEVNQGCSQTKWYDICEGEILFQVNLWCILQKRKRGEYGFSSEFLKIHWSACHLHSGDISIFWTRKLRCSCEKSVQIYLFITSSSQRLRF